MTNIAIYMRCDEQKRTILIVEDDKDIIEMEQLMFEREGYSVVTETDPFAAVATFKKNPDAFDLIITDLAMPKMSGLEFSEVVRAIRPSTPIMLLTGYCNPISGDTARALGIAVAQKPIGKKELCDWVQRLIA